jgi:hypothetical protein
VDLIILPYQVDAIVGGSNYLMAGLSEQFSQEI